MAPALLASITFTARRACMYCRGLCGLVKVFPPVQPRHMRRRFVKHPRHLRPSQRHC